jgi:hypothetical protein
MISTSLELQIKDSTWTVPPIRILSVCQLGEGAPEIAAPKIECPRQPSSAQLFSSLACEGAYGGVSSAPKYKVCTESSLCPVSAGNLTARPGRLSIRCLPSHQRNHKKKKSPKPSSQINSSKYDHNAIIKIANSIRTGKGHSRSVLYSLPKVFSPE